MAEDVTSPDDDIVETARQRYRAAHEHTAIWRDEARECFRFYAGDQWDEASIAKLAETNRVPITFNRVRPLIDAVLGHETNNRSEVKYLPRTRGDAKVAELLTAASDYFADACDAEDEQSDAFRDAMICGVGWTQIELTDERNPEYDLVESRVPTFEMLVDPASKKPNFADARYIFRSKRMPREEVEALWPDFSVPDVPADWSRGEDTGGDSGDPRDAYKSRGGGAQRDEGVLVIEYQWRDIEVEYAISRPDTGETRTLDEDAYESARKDIEEAGFDVAMKRRTVVRRAFLIGDELVQQDSPCPQHFTYTAITGIRDEDRGYWLGIVFFLLDPQRWANKWLVQMLHIINSNAKGGVMLEANAALNQADFERKWADPSGIVWVADGALQKGAVQPKPPPVPFTGLEKPLEYANAGIMQVSGVNAELLGLADRQQPGVLEWQRKQSAVTNLAPLFASLRRFRKMRGRTWLYMMQRYMSDGRMIRITSDAPKQMQVPTPMGPQAAQLQTGDNYVPYWRDPAVSEYDIIVDQAASAPNQKESTWSVLQALFPALKGMIDAQTMLVLLEYSPLPESLISQLKEMAQKRQENPQPPPELQKAQMEIQAEQQKAQAQMALEAQKAQQQQQLKQQEAVAQLALDREKAAADIALEREKIAQQAELAKAKAITDAQVKMHVAGLEVQATAAREGMQAELDSERMRGDQASSEAAQRQADADREAENARAMAMADALRQVAAVNSQLADVLGAEVVLTDDKGNVRRRARRETKRAAA